MSFRNEPIVVIIDSYCTHTHTHTYTQSQEHLFTWDMISNYEADLEEQAFTFRYSRDGREPRWVRVYSPHVSLSWPASQHRTGSLETPPSKLDSDFEIIANTMQIKMYRCVSNLSLWSTTMYLHYGRVKNKALGLAGHNEILIGHLYSLIQMRTNFGWPL